jgi:radical S-adenosyl methionine domain-containing protein 2
MLVTNGSRLSPETLGKLAGVLDWLGLSIDSGNQSTMEALGRSVGGKALSVDHYLGLAEAAHRSGIQLKVNTVVTSLNQDEDMAGLLLQLRPQRWKVLQALAIEDQNKAQLAELAVTDGAFQTFVRRHRLALGEGFSIAAEDNTAMTGSYLMVDPAGRFFDNATGGLRFSGPILDHGLEQALSEVVFSEERFRERGGLYDWSAKVS